MLMQYLWQPTLIFYRYFSHNPIILPTFVLAYPMHIHFSAPKQAQIFSTKN
jgi:hypothetical protein